MRVILDTNILVSGFIWGGVPRQLLECARSIPKSRKKPIELYTSTPLLDELYDVLSRQKFAELLATQHIKPAFLVKRYALLTTTVDPVPITRTVRDPYDDVVIATALAARARLIVSGDRDLLVLHPFNDIQILNAADALTSIQHSTIP